MLLHTREELQKVYKTVKDIAFGAAQCWDFLQCMREAGAMQGVVQEMHARYNSTTVGVYASCYTLRKEGYEDLRVTDWSGCSLGIVCITVACNTQKGYKAWRAILRS